MTNRNPLHIGNGLTFPLDLITDRGMILATTGAGKTFLMRVIAEETLDAGQQVVVVDPKGDFWGLRSSEDGKEPGYPIPVFGGEHADLPLEEGSGKFIAELIVEERLSAILDLSLFSKTKMNVWATDFAEALYHRNREAMLLLVDEVHTFAPQKYKGREQMLGAFTDLWGKGRKRGIGVLGASQRSALVNKDVLDLTGTMYFLRTSGPRDRAVIKDWLEYNAPADVMKDIMESVPSLENGEIWVYSPHTFKVLKRGKVRYTQTFDSSATPKPGQAARKPKTLAEIDVGSVTERMGAAIERAKAEDPKELRKKIGELQRELRTRPTETETVEVEKTVEVPVLSEDVVERLEKSIVGLRDIASEIMDGLKLLPSKRVTPVVRPQTRPVPVRREAPREVEPSGDITKPMQRVLDALAWLEAVGFESASKVQVAFLAGYKPNTGNFNNLLGAGRREGLWDYPQPGRILLSGTGRSVANVPAIPTTVEGFQEAVLAKLTAPQQRVLTPLLDAYPNALSNEELADAAGYQPNTGNFNNIKGQLRSLELTTYPSPGFVAALPILFLEVQ